MYAFDTHVVENTEIFNTSDAAEHTKESTDNDTDMNGRNLVPWML